MQAAIGTQLSCLAIDSRHWDQLACQACQLDDKSTSGPAAPLLQLLLRAVSGLTAAHCGFWCPA